METRSGNRVVNSRSGTCATIFPLSAIILALIVGCEQDKRLTGKDALKWGEFSGHPAQSIVENSHLINDFDVQVLYYGLRRKPPEASQVARYFSEYHQAKNEFQKRRIEKLAIQKFEELKQKLLSATLCLKIHQVVIGDYDFERKGFPLLGPPELGRSQEELEYMGCGESFPDEFGPYMGAIPMGTSVWMDNCSDGHIFPSFIPIDAVTAERLTREFDRGDYGRRTVSAYVIFTPTRSKESSNGSKTAYGTGSYCIIADRKGTVLAAYPKYSLVSHD